MGVAVIFWPNTRSNIEVARLQTFNRAVRVINSKLYFIFSFSFSFLFYYIFDLGLEFSMMLYITVTNYHMVWLSVTHLSLLHVIMKNGENF